MGFLYNFYEFCKEFTNSALEFILDKFKKGASEEKVPVVPGVPLSDKQQYDLMSNPKDVI